MLLALAISLAAPARAACTAGQPVAGSAETTPSSDFLIIPGGLVANPKTGLIWKRCAEGETWSGTTCTGEALTFDWRGALTHSVAAGDGDSNQWRVPNRNELASLVEFCGHGSAINLAIFPNTPGERFWSSTTFEVEPSRAWDVYFSDGYVGASGKSNQQHLRLVRSLTPGDFPFPQSISLGEPPNVQANGSGVLSANTTSDLPITFTSLTPEICAVSGNTLTGVSAGDCIIRADQAGNADFGPQSVVFNFPILANDNHTEVAAIPALSESLLLLLSALIGAIGLVGHRRSAGPGKQSSIR